MKRLATAVLICLAAGGCGPITIEVMPRHYHCDEQLRDASPPPGLSDEQEAALDEIWESSDE
jgi:hypothetical protein